MDKDVTKNRYDKFCLQVSVVTLLSVFLIMIVLTFVFAKKPLDQNYFEPSVINAVFSMSFLVAMVGVYKQNQIEKSTYGKFWPAFAIVLGVTYGFIAGILGHVFTYLMTDVLNYTTYLPILVSCLIALLCGLMAFFVAKGVFRLNQQKFLLLTVFTFVVGFCAATILTHNQDWWRTSICSLGMPRYVNSEYYNFTLILVGLLSALFAYYLRPQIRALVAKGLLDNTKVFVLASLYFMEMIAVALIGVFPYGLFKWMNPIHMFLASFVFFDVITILFFAFWFFRKFPRYFLVANYLLLLIGATFYYLTGSEATQLPFAVTEIPTIVAIVAWGTLFLWTINKINNSKDKHMLGEKQPTESGV